MTDEEVLTLYRCLLGRAPETPDTIAAFKAYYTDFDRGRGAILHSGEFATLFAGLTGGAPKQLADAFLQRAGGVADMDLQPSDAAIAGTMRLILRAHGQVHLAVVAGETEMPLADLLPFEGATAAVLHVAPHFPALLPRVGELPGGARLFQIQVEPAGLAALLHACGLRIDLLAMMGDAAEWIGPLRELIGPRAILLAAHGLEAATQGWPEMERPVQVGALQARMRGGWFLPVQYAPPAPPPERAETSTRLWLAAIMRNEATSIVNMLASVAPVVAGVVLVDTGSTDDGVARARAYLAGIGKPFVLGSFAGERFDDMRNEALRLVPAEADWVLMLDADEELCAEDFAPLLALIAGADRHAYALPRYNFPHATDKEGELIPYPDRQVRLLRHGSEPPVRYSGAVHEKVLGVEVGLLPLDAALLGQGRGGPHIHHLVRRFRTVAAEAEKQARYREIAGRHVGAAIVTAD